MTQRLRALLIVNVPCGNRYGGDNVFTADDQGNAHAHIALSTMPEARADLIPSVAVAYHSDGKTYASIPAASVSIPMCRPLHLSPQPTTMLG